MNSARRPDTRPTPPRPMMTGETAPLDLVTIRAAADAYARILARDARFLADCLDE